MFKIKTTEDIEVLNETYELECKKATGRDGQGTVPESFWETYSAMANTNGGVVLLGIKEKNGKFSVANLPDPERLKRDIYSTVNNPDKVSVNLLSNQSIKEIEIDGNTILKIEIPRASRSQRPVFLNGNPLGGNAYRRLHEGDQKLSDEDVKRYLAEQVEESRDSGILPVGFTFNDLCMESIRSYRQAHQNIHPGHPWNKLDDSAFLEKIGAIRMDRMSGEQGMTRAGLLMFGTHPIIQQAFPNFMLDYQERPEVKTEQRWVDRITLDGMWPGNLYEFYLKVYPKLVADLKTPFHLEDGQRQEDTPAHVALREALVNTLVHADYSGRASILVVKRPNMFGFRNPGTMRIPVEVALKGGEPDCRNRLLHQMFRYIGLGEQSGSGIPKIIEGWKLSHWRPPLLQDKLTPYEQTLMELRMIDLFPHDTVKLLRLIVGRDNYDQLDHTSQLALALAFTEGTLTHGRLSQLTDSHPADLTRILKNLVHEKGLLTSKGEGRGVVYHLTAITIPHPNDVFSTGFSDSSFPSNSPDNTERSPDNTKRSPDKCRDNMGRLISKHLHQIALIDNIEKLSEKERRRLQEIAKPAIEKKRLSPIVMEKLLIEICEGHYVTTGSLAKLVNRKPESLREQYLTPMVRKRQLTQAFPATPNDPRQAYIAMGSIEE